MGLSTTQSLERLLQGLVAFWYPAVVDHERGGYRVDCDARGRWGRSTRRPLVFQARTVWFFSRLAASPLGDSSHLGAAAHGFRFLRDALYDAEHGGFWWKVDVARDRPIRREKNLYGQAFALYALAGYAEASGDAGALAMARRQFEVIDRHAHDPVHGGYLQAFTDDWRPLSARADALGVDSTAKTVNTHLHLLEALTAYFRLTGDPLARERTAELVRMLSTRVLRPGGATSDIHSPDWQPLPAGGPYRVSYGHDLELAWLLLDGAAALGGGSAGVLPVAEGLWANAVGFGLDRESGGFYSSGPLGAPAADRAKVWWVQAEALVGALLLHRVTGDAAYLGCFGRTLDWVIRRQADWAGGDWHHTIDPRGHPRGAKSAPWKDPYHAGRALLTCLELLQPVP